MLQATCNGPCHVTSVLSAISVMNVTSAMRVISVLCVTSVLCCRLPAACFGLPGQEAVQECQSRPGGLTENRPWQQTGQGQPHSMGYVNI